ncbi:hypothetical protein GCM10010174_03720 [Kutzneria viridogrisea]|uniref:DNA-binding GntR family transcriptional regulator n=1 Tax=Kutzneria viridogrisea TaxID=47990 RepID=A0ABR6BRH1_9PSEU|nr:DNA-binding GntR family transcriptional regulator [Kutzneria viridogrisea]
MRLTTTQRQYAAFATLSDRLRTGHYDPTTWPATMSLADEFELPVKPMQETLRWLSTHGLLWQVHGRIWQPVQPRAQITDTAALIRDIEHRLAEWRWTGLDNTVYQRRPPTLHELATQYRSASRSALRDAVDTLADRGLLRCDATGQVYLPGPGATVPAQRGSADSRAISARIRNRRRRSTVVFP